jgi:hypothetical protein
VAIQYWKNNDTWWFGMTIGFTGVPSIIVNMISFIKMINAWTCITAVLQLSFLGCYIEALKSPDSLTYFIAKLRYLETITESAPQWCLQVYIMLRQWYFPSYTVVSSVLSLASLAWSITTLEKERAIKKKDDMESRDIVLPPMRKFGPHETVFFLIWQLFTLISRLSAIVLFAYVFRYYVIIFLAAHWLLLVVIIFLIQRSGGKSFGKSLLLSLLAACPSLFHVSKTVIPTEHPKAEITIGYIFILVENIIMVTLSLKIEKPDVSHMDVLQPVAISCLVGGSVLSAIGFIFCWHCMDFSSSPPERSCEDEPDLFNTENTDFGQINDYPRSNDITGMAKQYHRSKVLSSQGTMSSNEPAVLYRRTIDEMFILPSNRYTNNGYMAETTENHHRNENTQMDYPSQALSSPEPITQEEPAAQLAENESLGSYLYGIGTSAATSVYNWFSSFFNPYLDPNLNGRL